MHHLSVIVGIVLVLQLFSQAASGNEQLLTAARQGNINTLKNLLNSGVDVNSARGDGVTALTEAIFYQADHTVIDFLINAGADVNTRDDYGVSLLHLACSNHNAELVKKLLTSGADADLTKITGETPLMICANSGSVEGVRALLAEGVDVNANEEKEDQTALMWAAAEGHDEIVKLLVDAGADVNTRSRTITLIKPYVIDFDLDLSIWGSNYPSTVRWPKVSGSFTALHFAARNGHTETARVLLEAGADINESHPELGNALLIATASGHEDLAHYLLMNGADPNVKDTWGITPLHYALHKGLLNLNGVRPVEAKSADWKRKDMTGLVEVLLDYGADPDARVEFEYPYLEYPFLARGDSLPAQISPVGATPLLLAAASGNLEAMYLLEEVSNTSVTTVGGANLFMLAAGAGAETNIRSEDEALDAAKHVLSEVGGVDINAYLTDRVPGGPARDRVDGRTALHFAALYGWPKMIRFLVENGAEVDVEDRYGVTPLMLAMGDPEGRLAQNVGEFNNDHRFRRPGGARQSSGEGNNELANLLLDLGATPCECKPMDLTGR
jgi:ankyrin repeat protein